ncbi:Na/Pi cotransporter family protein [Rhizobium sp. CC-YZS058]|uniref:Na/Pi cotransporter family protein n=1 Tax=Rhizobium sp. CC-YZS058 TaxID=3042153 RepID=UPI002B0522A1|nr:Na/Pi cotransporter family protein [Rhizobium sp. CC-YZS058]MEA3533161.1 Na/Pi cotransporter family protein [Rhizobium sp. CC-YZS058]
MQSTIVMINLLGAVALLLVGLAQVKDGVSRAFGARLRTGLATATRRSWRAFVSGLVATLALQSSTATALMVSSFVERSLVKPRMAQIVLLGANLGTALTAWIVSTGIEWLSPLLILCGFALTRSAATARQGGGVALIGIGLMLLSLHLLDQASAPMRHSAALATFIRLLDGAWPVAFAFSAGLAFACSSSLAIVVLILSLASTGVLPGGLLVALVLGANLGGAIPPYVATLRAAPAARRITLGNLIVRACGCLAALPFAGQAAALLARLPGDKLPVDAHLLFNLVLALLAWPLTRSLTRLMVRLVPEEAGSDQGPSYLDAHELSTPVVALTSATREVLGVGDLIERMLLKAADAFRTGDPATLREIPALEQRVDRLQQEVKLYLSRLGRSELTEENARRSIAIIDYAINLEHIGDIIEKGLSEQVTKKVSLGLTFSEAGFAELSRFFDLTIDNLRIAQTIFVTGDIHLARRLMEVKVEVRNLEKQSAERHFQRLREGQPASLQTSSLHLDMLRDLKRINAHIVSVAHPIMDTSGLLSESRLRAM